MVNVVYIAGSGRIGSTLVTQVLGEAQRADGATPARGVAPRATPGRVGEAAAGPGGGAAYLQMAQGDAMRYQKAQCEERRKAMRSAAGVRGRGETKARDVPEGPQRVHRDGEQGQRLRVPVVSIP